MNTQELQNQIEVVDKRVKTLERIAIQLKLDPQTKLYLDKEINDLITVAVALLPTQTYSSSTPSGTAVAGSIWMQNTGSLATNTIWMYSGSAWVQIK